MISNAVRNIIKDAVKKSEYYRCAFEGAGIDEKNIDGVDNLEDLPILSRETLVNERERILDKEYKFVNRKNLIQERTSGSTGRYVDVYWSPNDYLRSIKSLWEKRKKWYGISAGDRYCTFFTTINTKDKVVENRTVMMFSSYYLGDEDFAVYSERIRSFQPKWLMLTPSFAILLYEYYRKKGMKLPESVCYIELFGENVSNTVYELIKNYFGCKTAVMYGAKEVNGIALMCPNGKLHVLDDNVFVENHGGKLIVSSLRNKVFPIIRYDIGDYAELRGVECSCGGSDLEVVNLLGKEQFLSFLDEQNGITTMAYKNILNQVDQLMGYPFLQSQIEYLEHITRIHLYCRKEYRGWKEEIKKELYCRVEEYTSNTSNIEILFYNEPIPINEKTGKLPMIRVD